MKTRGRATSSTWSRSSVPDETHRRAHVRPALHVPSGRTYHVKFNPPKVDMQGRRDRRAARAAQGRRGSDGEEAPRASTTSRPSRWWSYYSKWAATGDEHAPKYHRIDGIGTVDEVRDRIFAALGFGRHRTRMARNAFYAQSGGVTAVINASAAGVIETARKHRKHIGKVYAGRNGIIGALTEDLIDTSKEAAGGHPRARATRRAAPSARARYKLKGVEKDGHEYERLIEVFKAHDIGYFFYNGGNDSADTCLKVSQISATLGYPHHRRARARRRSTTTCRSPTCCPGFGSVAKYVATSMMEAGLDVESMAKTSTKVFILEVMGRHAGWITAATGPRADARPATAPHILLFPEIAVGRGSLPRAR